MEISATVTVGTAIEAAAQIAVESVSNGGTVTIYDQNDNVVEVVTSPGSYHVIVLTEINDEEPYEDLIIDDN